MASNNVFLDKNKKPLTFSPYGGTIYLEEAQYQMHAGKHYYAEHNGPKVQGGPIPAFGFITPDTSTQIHLTVSPIIDERGYFQIFEDGVIAGTGGALPIYSYNRMNSVTSAGVKVYFSTTFFSAGTEIFRVDAGGSMTLGGNMKFSNYLYNRNEYEFILKQNATYNFILNCTFSGTIIYMRFDWYEVD